jgi:hypothetical protein
MCPVAPVSVVPPACLARRAVSDRPRSVVEPGRTPLARAGRTGSGTRIVPMSTTQIAPETSDTRTDEGDDHSHYARREEIVRASVEGGRVTALCGYKFEPVRDPSRFPICPKCKELVEMAQQFG